MGPFSRLGSTRETKTNSERQSETCSLVLVVLGPCPHVRSFASDCRVTNSNLSFGRESLCREPVGQNGVLTAKWCCQLTEYDIEYVSRITLKGQAIADHLAKFPIDDDTPINSDFSDEGILQVNDEEESLGWKMYFDGTVNSTGSGIGAVLISPERRHFPIAAKIDFPYTNNIAEYEACILGLQMLKQWKTKDPKLVPYHEYLEELTENFKNISFRYTPRMKNQFVDALATLASMVSITKENLIEPLEFEIARGPAHRDMIEAVDGKPWYADIKHLLQTGQFPAFTDRHDRRTL
ncbi:hypothetical protein CRG98_001896 [Punica granatum]|uniref:RNase H type-1 domain-containing protein n=1 Tax=Punica granatum TaxID=22663 RepID=A0A2I0LAK1_PUNGR|nr:hypothetical protein CRG98_001896 [Punica granatum]